MGERRDTSMVMSLFSSTSTRAWGSRNLSSGKPLVRIVIDTRSRYVPMWGISPASAWRWTQWSASRCAAIVWCGPRREPCGHFCPGESTCIVEHFRESGHHLFLVEVHLLHLINALLERFLRGAGRLKGGETVCHGKIRPHLCQNGLRPRTWILLQESGEI